MDSLSLNFTFKYPDTGVAIYEILDENGNSYTDFSLKAPLERTMIYKTIVRGDQTQFTLDGFTKSNGTEILPYEIEITHKDQKIQYYPTFYPREEIPIPNGLSEYFQLKKITKIQSITKEQRMSSYGLLSQKNLFCCFYCKELGRRKRKEKIRVYRANKTRKSN